jgi:hypothetical protein
MPGTLGKDFKFYRNSDDPYDVSPTWVLVDNLKDVTRNGDLALADMSTRASNVRMQKGTLSDFSVDIQMVHDSTDANWLAFEAAYYRRLDVEILLLDGLVSVNGSRGVRFMAAVTKWTENEPLEDGGTTDITFTQSYFPTNVARRVQVTGGAVVDVTP